MKYLLAILLIISVSLAIPADNIGFKGQIIDINTGNPLTGVEIKFINGGNELTAYSDRWGQFYFELKPGKYSIQFKTYSRIDTLLTDYVIEDVGDTQIFKIEQLKDPVNSRRVKKGRSDEGTLAIDESIERIESPVDYSGEADPLIPSTMSSGSGREAGLERAESISEIVITDKSVSEAGEGFVPRGSRSSPSVSAGLLTSGEVNDFRKWDLWKDIDSTDLSKYKDEWEINPHERYTVQLYNSDQMPLIDANVNLKSNTGLIVWSGRTDNTGKAELWANVLNNKYSNGNYSLEVIYNDDEYEFEDIIAFHDGINSFGVNANCNVPENIDIAFVVDATGSMGDEIEYLKAELNDIIGKISEKHKNSIVNLGSVFYRDTQDDYIVAASNLSNDISKTTDFISRQRADGGGDFPEAVDLALQEAINNLTWSEDAVARLLFLILDAPPHNNPEVKAKLAELSAKASQMGIRIIPVTCSGIDKSTEYLMRSLALITNGTYVFLTDHSGIGGAHIEPSTDKYDVELLNDLFIRLIDQFTVTPECDNKELAITGLDNNIFNHDEKKIDDANPDHKDIVNIVNCYPNPTNGDLNIEIENNLDEMYLVDISGKLLEKFMNIRNGKQKLNLTKYPTGMYFLKFRYKDLWASKKIMLIR